ncbi:surface antigen (D15) [Thalassoporum mexicanum PCC 7367]|uniref:BamA/TamA family outer membrane protein n=1 Tax=Thalassoporum mexicanum TaxID=3457544 RepID=UPI00029FC818|nr:BamA/TamA family outer membrane protein [Pseudanabaena sp. PCC 7367]AFY69356.1 surface antigen (D15) [Pseudanabaena sp. PCC 7367]
MRLTLLALTTLIYSTSVAVIVPSRVEATEPDTAIAGITEISEVEVDQVADQNIAEIEGTQPIETTSELFNEPLVLTQVSQNTTPATEDEDDEDTDAPAEPTESTESPESPDRPDSPGSSPTETEPPQATEDIPVLIGEVLVVTPAGTSLPTDLENEVYQAIDTTPGRTTTRKQLQADIESVFGTGYFSNVQAQPEDTDIGVRVTFVVQPYPVLRAITTEGTQVLDAGIEDPETGETIAKSEVLNNIFGDQVGKTANLRFIQEGVEELEQFYQDRGYVLAQVVPDGVRLSPDGTVTLSVAEGEIEAITVAFLNEEGQTTNEDGTIVEGRTHDYIVTRELSLQPGEVFNRNTVQDDLQQVFNLGIFDDVNLGLSPGEDPRKVIVTVNVQERNTGSIAVGAGISSASGLFGTVSFQQQNLGGNNQKLGLDIQVGERELLFDLNFTDPWIAGDPHKTSFTANIFNRRLFSFIFDDPDDLVSNVGVGPDDDTPRENRLGFGFGFSRPLDDNTTASVGFRYERVRITDDDNNTFAFDNSGNKLSVSDSGKDDLFLFQTAVARDLRNDPVAPTSGSVLRLANEVAAPFGSGSIFFNRIRASYSFYLPVQFTNFNEGPQALAFNAQIGTILGDAPPYEAFSLGGSSTVRGWDQGAIGAGKSFALLSAEYRFPIISILNGVVFGDVGTTFGTDNDVIGRPSVVRDKPGTGAGYGVGVRIRSPLGAIRIDYGFASDGGNQFSFGLGEKF